MEKDAESILNGQMGNLWESLSRASYYGSRKMRRSGLINLQELFKRSAIVRGKGNAVEIIHVLNGTLLLAMVMNQVTMLLVGEGPDFFFSGW